MARRLWYPRRMTSVDSIAFTGTPAAEIEIGTVLVRQLLNAQHPDLATLKITPAASGWDNAMLRLDDHLGLRLPRRAAAALIVNEQTWLQVLAPRLPLNVPAPVRAGVPDHNYPWAWSVTPWFAGETADVRPPGDYQAKYWRRSSQPFTTLPRQPGRITPSVPCPWPAARRFLRKELKIWLLIGKPSIPACLPFVGAGAGVFCLGRTTRHSLRIRRPAFQQPVNHASTTCACTGWVV